MSRYWARHAWLDSLADAGVKVTEYFYNCLSRDVGPTHPPIIDLGYDNDSIVTMDDTKDLVNQPTKSRSFYIIMGA